MAGNRLGGRQGTAYLGTNAMQPPNWNFNDRDPNQYDTQNVALGDLWMNTATREVWVLVSLQGDVNSRGPLADWIMFSGGSGTVVSLTANSGGVIDPDINGNINVLGDTTTINVVGTPLNNTLTISAVGTGLMQSLTANSGGAVFPLAGNTNIVGDTTTINIVGVPGTHTLTASTTGAVAVSFPTDSGTAIPALGILQIKSGLSTLNSGSSVKFSGATNIVTLNVTDSSSNTIVGNNAGNLTLSGSNNTSLGKTTLNSLTTANANTVIGSLSGALITTGANNTILGEGSGTGITTGSYNLVIGQGAGTALTTESNNVLIDHTGSAGVSGLFAIGMKFRTINYNVIHTYPGDNSSGGSNFFAGIGAGNFTLSNTNIANTGIGNEALQFVASSNNTAVGFDSLGALTSGSQNTALGTNTGYSAGPAGLVSGSRNVFIGMNAASNYTSSESDNIIINNAGVIGDSNILRVGAGTGTGSQQLNKSFIHGIRGKTTTVNDAIAVLIDSAGQLGTVSSSIRYKENVADMADYSSPLMRLRPVVFNYKERSPEKKEYGLIAEEVVELFPDLVVYNQDGEVETIKYHVLSAILLNELQKLSQRVTELEKRLS